MLWLFVQATDMLTLSYKLTKYGVRVSKLLPAYTPPSMVKKPGLNLLNLEEDFKLKADTVVKKLI